jgi:hypothetical protein
MPISQSTSPCEEIATPGKPRLFSENNFASQQAMDNMEPYASPKPNIVRSGAKVKTCRIFFMYRFFRRPM